MENEIFLIRRNNLKNFFITYVFCNCRSYRSRVCRSFECEWTLLHLYIYHLDCVRIHTNVYLFDRVNIYSRLFFVTRGFLRVSFLSRILDGKSMTHMTSYRINDKSYRVYFLFTHLEIPRNSIFLESLFISRFVTKWTKCDVCHFPRINRTFVSNRCIGSN